MIFVLRLLRKCRVTRKIAPPNTSKITTTTNHETRLDRSDLSLAIPGIRRFLFGSLSFYSIRTPSQFHPSPWKLYTLPARNSIRKSHVLHRQKRSVSSKASFVHAPQPHTPMLTVSLSLKTQVADRNH